MYSKMPATCAKAGFYLSFIVNSPVGFALEIHEKILAKRNPGIKTYNLEFLINIANQYV